MPPSSPFMSHAQTPQSGYRLRPVRMDASVHPPSVSPSPPPSSAYSADVPTPSSVHMLPPHPTQSQSQDPHTLPPLVLSPSNPNAPPRPWSPSAGVREIDAAPPPRRAGLPAPPTGHDLMALFPAPSPSAPPTYAAVPNAASGSGVPSPGANVPIPIPTSGWFINEERRFFAREGKEIVRLKREEVLEIGPSGSNGTGGGSCPGISSIGTKREREGDRDREMASMKRSPPANHPGPSTMLPGSASGSFHSSPPPPPAPHQSLHSRSHSASQPQQPFLTLVQSNTSFRQPPPPPPRDRDPARYRERERDAEGDMHMQSTDAPPMNALSQHQQGRGPYAPPPSAPHHGSAHSSPAPPPSAQQVQHHIHGHVRAPSYGAPPPPQQQPQQYNFSHTPPSASHPHSQPPPPHTRGSYTHPPPPPPVSSRSSPSYSVQPPSHHESVAPPAAPQALSQTLHPTYSAVPLPPAQHPPYTHHQQTYSVSPPSQPQSAYPPDGLVRDRERGREAYPSPSPSREGYPSHSNMSAPHGISGYSEGYGSGSAYLAASERRRAGKHTRRVVVKA